MTQNMRVNIRHSLRLLKEHPCTHPVTTVYLSPAPSYTNWPQTAAGDQAQKETKNPKLTELQGGIFQPFIIWKSVRMLSRFVPLLPLEIVL